MPAVLLITQDESIRQLAQGALTSAGHEVVTASDPERGVRSLFALKADALVVDSTLGGDDLDWLCQRLRNAAGGAPIVFLASPGARWAAGSLPIDERTDAIISRPFCADDLRGAVEQVLVAARRSRATVALAGDLQLDRATLELRGEGPDVRLTPTEFRLVEYLAERRGDIASSEELLENVWRFHPGTGSSDLVRAHMRNLRAKLHLAAPGREMIQTIPRRGYRLAWPP